MKIEDYCDGIIEISGELKEIKGVDYVRMMTDEYTNIEKDQAIKIIKHLQKVFELGVYEPIKR